MRAGSLKNTISIENAVSSKNSFGENITTWFLFKTLPSSIEEIKDSEVLNGEKKYSVGIRKFRIRYMVGLDLKMRIKHLDNIYEIVDIENPYEKNKELLIFAKRVY